MAEEQGRCKQHYQVESVFAYHGFLVLEQPVDQELNRFKQLEYVNEAQEVK